MSGKLAIYIIHCWKTTEVLYEEIISRSVDPKWLSFCGLVAKECLHE